MQRRWQSDRGKSGLSLPRLLNSWLFLLIGIGLFFILAVVLTKEAWRSYQVSSDVAQLEAEIGALEQKNVDLADFVDYLGSDAYQEQAAKERLGLKKPGEKVVALPDISVADESGDPLAQSIAEEKEDTRSNPRKWWDYYFAQKIL